MRVLLHAAELEAEPASNAPSGSAPFLCARWELRFLTGSQNNYWGSQSISFSGRSVCSKKFFFNFNFFLNLAFKKKLLPLFSGCLSQYPKHNTI